MTDSLLNSISDSDFHSLNNYRCVKRVNPELTKYFDNQSDLNASDIVIISGGINDLSCHNYSAESLADVVRPKLERCCK